MELFSVQRYTGRDDGKPLKATTPNEQKQEDEEVLQKLLSKVEKRKKKHQEREQRLKEQQKIEEEQQQEDAETGEAPAAPMVVEGEAVEGVGANDDADPLATAGDDDLDGFKVLGEDNETFGKRQKIDAVLPTWLAHPTVISTNIKEAQEDAHTIEELPYLSPAIVRALKETNITHLFPVQSSVVPWLLEAHAKPNPYRPRDICVSAPTGSGKTLAFAIPVVQLLEQRVERTIRALAVLPVAELAQQIYSVFKKLCEHTDLKVCLLSTQNAFASEQEKLVECYKGSYHSKVDIVVTTPGRLVDHLHATKGFCLKSLKFLIIDEADRIMDEIFQNWLYHLDTHVHATADQLLSGRSVPLNYQGLAQTFDSQPHKLLFSATLSQDPEKLQNLRLFQPKLFTSVLSSGLEELRQKYILNAEQEAEQQKALARGDFIGKFTTPAELSEKYCITESRLKPLTLFALITEQKWQKFLCFTNSAEASSRLAFVLLKLFNKTDFVIRELSALSKAKARAKILNRFAFGKINGLICSDALARGIDVPDVDVVVSYDPPRHIKTYIHRIGRTARAGRPGMAVTLLSQKELQTFNGILANVGKVITEELHINPDFEVNHATTYASALKELREKLEKDKRYKLLLKERLKHHASIHKTPEAGAKLSVMQKLQLQAEERLYEKDKAEEAALDEELQTRMTKRNPKNSYKEFKEKRKQHRLLQQEQQKNAKALMRKAKLKSKKISKKQKQEIPPSS